MMRAFARAGCVLLAVGRAAAQSGEPFNQDALVDGVVCIEAEHYHSISTTSWHAWVPVTNGNYAGAVGMQAWPNAGTNNNANYVTRSPRLDYRVNFNRAGVHVIAVRGVAPSSADDSLHAGLNGAAVSTSDRLYGYDGTLRWSYGTLDTPRALINVPSPGVHTVNLWMREDGFIADRLFLSSNTNFLPTGIGPPESPQGSNTVAELHPLQTEITGLTLSNGQLVVSFQPVGGAEAYQSAVAGAPGENPVPGGDVAAGYAMAVPLDQAQQVIAVEATPLSTNAQMAALVLNRLAYGPTPDELVRVLTGPGAIGAAGFIAEQLAPEGLFETINSVPAVAALALRLDAGLADLPDLQAWHLLRAIGANRQFLETLLQFTDNHFTTYFWKNYDFFRNAGYSDTDARRQATALDYDELQRWRQVLLNPNGTFLDLLRISAESRSMIIYLDSVLNVAGAPNENYAREILELFCMGVDNGYDQNDIVAMAPAWTGWSVAQVAPADQGNPHATPNTNKVAILPPAQPDWLCRKGSNAPPVDWFATDYVPDTNWFPAPAPVGYGYSNVVTAISDMSNRYTTLYLRKDFVVTNVDVAAQARLRLFVDDGCVIHLNGQEILRYNCPAGGLAHTSRASVTVGKATWTEVAVSNLAGHLVSGTNRLAVHLLNVTRGSSDLIFDCELAVPAPWSFVFLPALHSTTNKTIFPGRTVSARFGPPYAGQPYELALPVRTGTNGIQDGYDIMSHLANLPYTMEFISTKLCRLLVHEDFRVGEYYNVADLTPEAALIKACMAAWDTPGPDGRKGNLRQVLSVILQSDLFRSEAAARQKTKTPMEYAASAVRALRADLGGGVLTAGTDGYDLIDPLWYFGMELFVRVFPDGWSEDGSDWIDTGTINERLRFIENLCMDTNDVLKDVDYGSGGADNWCDPVALLQARLPSGSWTDAGAVTDYLLAQLFPGEGTANLALERAAAMDYLNSDDTGVPGTSLFSTLVPGSAAYQSRVRSAVALLLSGPKFHEQ